MNSVNYLPIFKALADETRLSIVQLLAHGEECGCKILENFDITQPTLSYHMKVLCDSGLVQGLRDGSWMRYSLDKTVLKRAQTLLLEICMTQDRRPADNNCDKLCD
ncbi:MAG TPA: metalloregulator ArsR/SmtB family transcription factor [Clostridia bacterium]|nr:metalloregulator ArsR/SmtB family transcription factor [Clostridia bacterium]